MRIPTFAGCLAILCASVAVLTVKVILHVHQKHLSRQRRSRQRQIAPRKGLQGSVHLLIYSILFYIAHLPIYTLLSHINDNIHKTNVMQYVTVYVIFDYWFTYNEFSITRTYQTAGQPIALICCSTLDASAFGYVFVLISARHKEHEEQCLLKPQQRLEELREAQQTKRVDKQEQREREPNTRVSEFKERRRHHRPRRPKRKAPTASVSAAAVPKQQQTAKRKHADRQ